MFGLPGTWIVAFAIAASLLSMMAGILLGKNSNRSSLYMKRRFFEAGRPMKTLAVIIIAGILTSLTGQWLAGAILVVIATLLIASVLAHFVL